MEERYNSEDTEVDDRTAIEWMLRNRLRGMNWSLSGQGCCEHSNETLGRLNGALSRPPEKLSARQNVICFVELVI